ncbi:MAG: methyltransferase domain-containing protein [Bryobacteraceae bacterium]
MTSNPWLDVPLEDYEGHMRAPGVEQLDALADLFGEALAFCRPESVAILGVAGGNGLDRIDTGVTKRIVGVDIHPEYLAAVRTRYPELPLTLVCCDLDRGAIEEAPAAMVHAALIFEHAGIEGCLESAVRMVAAGGFLVVVLQLPSATAAGVAATRFETIQALGSRFRLVDKDEFAGLVSGSGLTMVEQRQRSLPSGKAFWLGVFRKTAAGQASATAPCDTGDRPRRSP